MSYLVQHKQPVAPECVRFEYTKNNGAYHHIDLGNYDVLQVVGDHTMACYEWWVISNGRVACHSDCGYGCRESALRDGLIAYLGAPDADRLAKLAKAGAE